MLFRSTATVTFVVSKRLITVTPAAQTATYTGSSVSISNSYSISSGTLAGSDSITALVYTYTSVDGYNSTTAPTNVGGYTITPSAPTFSPGSSTNYTITFETSTATIAKADQTVTWSATNSYPTNAKPVTWSVEASGQGSISYAVTTAGSINCSINGSRKLIWTTDATGTCVVTVTAAGNSNYNSGTLDKTFTITAASLSSQSITFADPGAKIGRAHV